MKMVHYRKDGFSMYTKLLRFLVKLERRASGHCMGDEGGSGHCY